MQGLETLIGRTCSRITVDIYAPPLVLWFLYGGPAMRIEINGALVLNFDGATHALEPGRDADALAPALTLLGRAVTNAEVRADDTLVLGFEGEATMEVHPSPEISEPWWFEIDPDQGDED